MKNRYLIISQLLFLILLLSFSSEGLFAQCFIVATQEQKDVMWREWGVIVPDKQGNFASYDDCLAYLNSAISDPVQRNRHYCDCDLQDENGSYDHDQQTMESPLVKPKTQAELNELQALAEQKKRLVERKQFSDTKEDVTGKLKGNKSLDQLKTSSNLSLKGQQNIKSDQTNEARSLGESAFTDGKITPDNKPYENPIRVSQPTQIDHQKSLFNYIDLETKRVQSKIIEVQKEKTQLLEKKIQIQEKMTEQKLNISNLRLEKLEAKEESKVEEIDSLLLLATQMLEESEQLNENATRELKNKNNLVKENEALLNKYQETITTSKEHPEKSEQLLKDLQGEKK